MKITITGLNELNAKLDNIAKRKVASAAAAALKVTADQVQEAVKAEMTLSFDRVTPWALKTVRVDKSRADEKGMTAYVGLSYAAGTHNLWEAPSFAPHEVHGGTRQWKASERQLRAAGILPPDRFIAPARDSWLDSYGNIPGPRMVQILSSVKAFSETGYLMNATGKSRSKSKNRYFVMRRAGRPIGIWERLGPGNVVPVIMFINRPQYTPKFDFYGVAKATVFKNWPRNFRSILSKYLK